MVLQLSCPGSYLAQLTEQVKLVLDGQSIMLHAAISQRHVDTGIDKPLTLRCHLPALTCLQLPQGRDIRFRRLPWSIRRIRCLIHAAIIGQIHRLSIVPIHRVIPG